MAPELTAPVASLTLLRPGSLEKGAGREEGPQNHFHSPVGVNGLAWGHRRGPRGGAGCRAHCKGVWGTRAKARGPGSVWTREEPGGWEGSRVGGWFKAGCCQERGRGQAPRCSCLFSATLGLGEEAGQLDGASQGPHLRLLQTLPGREGISGFSRKRTNQICLSCEPTWHFAWSSAASGTVANACVW